MPRYEKAHTSYERVMFLRDITKRIFGKILVFGLHIFGQNFTVTVGNGNLEKTHMVFHVIENRLKL